MLHIPLPQMLHQQRAAVSTLRREQQVHVIGFRRAGVASPVFPALDTVLSPGDAVAIVAPLPSLVRLRSQ